jgi:hypothetical protein
MEHLNAGSEAASEELDQALARAVRQFIAEAVEAESDDAEAAARAAALPGARATGEE